MKMRILVTPKFKKQLKKLPKHIQNLAIEKGGIFRNDPYDRRLKTHKLHGKFENLWSFSVDYDCRIIFKFINNQTVYFFSIGNHNIYD